MSGAGQSAILVKAAGLWLRCFLSANELGKRITIARN